MPFKILSLKNKNHVCLSPLAATVRKNKVTFRISATLAAECCVKRGDPYSVAYDEEGSLFALVHDPDNESGSAVRAMGDKTNSSLRSTLEYPRVGVLLEAFAKVDNIKGLHLYAKRGKGKIVFHTPKIKEDQP